MPVEAKKDTRRVFQEDADELHTTTTPDPAGPPTIVEQPDATKLKSTVTQAEKDRTITGNVGVLDITDTRINPAEEDGNLASIKAKTDNIPTDPSREGGNLASILTQLDITLSSLRDALRGASTKDFSTLEADIESIKNTDGVKKITNDVNVIQLTQLVPFEYDYISLGYTGDNLTSVVYKTGGAGGATVATLTLAYTNSRLDSITRT